MRRRTGPVARHRRTTSSSSVTSSTRRAGITSRPDPSSRQTSCAARAIAIASAIGSSAGAPSDLHNFQNYVYNRYMMKRLQVMIEAELDADLEREAARTGRSKGALVRDAVRRHIRPLPPLEQDAIWKMAGKDSFEPVPPEQIDDIVYGDA